MTILITGGNGFVGKNLVNTLNTQELYDFIAPSSKEYNLLSSLETYNMFYDHKPSIVIHLAATCGGIGINADNPGRFIYENLKMGLNVIEAAKKYKVDKFIMLGSVCSYPKHAPVPFKETDIWNGYPEETNAPYGIAKKTLMELIISYHKQYRFPGVNLIPVNMYGPYDNFNSYSSHVIPAVILKIDEAIKTNTTPCFWGTGEASREFLYVQDCVDAIILALQADIGPEPINIGTGKEIQIKDLVFRISEKMGYKGDIFWDFTKPDGQPRRCLDISRARDILKYQPRIKLEEGLEKTIDWYKN